MSAASYSAKLLASLLGTACSTLISLANSGAMYAAVECHICHSNGSLH
jgi:hypothetical protein